MSLQLGIIGKPNVGKSTFFTALTMHEIEIASYPFTTINPNVGVGYVRNPCPHTILGKECNPRNSICMKGIRFVPVEVIDVAGLVPGAHEGRGLGNKFLDDLRQAHGFILVIDASGSTDSEGNIGKVGEFDPTEDIKFVREEIVEWFKSIIGKNWHRLARRVETEHGDIAKVLAEILSGVGIKYHEIKAVLRDFDEKPTKWSEEDLKEISRRLLDIAKPMVVAANKADQAPEDLLKKLIGMEDFKVIPCSALYEYTLKKASMNGYIEYIPGSDDFKILKELNEKQRKALERIREFMQRFGGTGVQKILEEMVFNSLGYIIVYPVEDENRWCDKDGNVLPDAYLMPPGSTALDLAYRVHTEIGEKFVRAIDAKTKKILGRDYVLRMGDVIKIVAHR